MKNTDKRQKTLSILFLFKEFINFKTLNHKLLNYSKL